MEKGLKKTVAFERHLEKLEEALKGLFEWVVRSRETRSIAKALRTVARRVWQTMEDPGAPRIFVQASSRLILRHFIFCACQSFALAASRHFLGFGARTLLRVEYNLLLSEFHLDSMRIAGNFRGL